ncbi:MAG: pseudouridine synthase [Paracoccaceae bacterium]|nr:pseudouridine synthase [Paracoccaceae bacterium]
MTQLILFNKPFNVLSQFTNKGTDGTAHQTLSDFIDIPDVYAAGRLDKDSEGLLVLTDSGALQAKISNPKYNTSKSYWAQVEGLPDEQMLEQMRQGLRLKDGITRPAKVALIDQPPSLWRRYPPVRYRKSVPDCWIDITISEGRNRQVRRMTAAIGCPTLRLIRHRVGSWKLGNLASGAWRKS